jgi:hypothetical protein
VAGSCECGNEALGSIKCGNLLSSLKPVSFFRRNLLCGLSKCVDVNERLLSVLLFTARSRCKPSVTHDWTAL